MNRLALYAAAASIVVAAWGGSLGLAYLKGRGDEGRERDRAQLEATIDGVRINLESWRDANTNTAALEAEVRRLTGEANNARRRIAAITAAPPAGYVGRTALVDPAVSRAFFDGIRCVHDDASAACRAAADGADQ